ncbi:VPS9 domain-containing protein, putative [Plasmodium chabaudi chabaudi]|uniref:VPS9 domain-containing protein, putative n=1 Tax=Plasmodium chabaudi chabaudi TaxID=31271 RepID=A0A077TML5_PLACU|nr:VPS9 domain-containing protein, putative [Plasmodium chabaudi chabaudi]SCM00455.1 conserved Plasmodium protein, unknown function [Plasmodium chabaudi chabaudi]VTZ67979.1 VPS9 domain-containing protein, putative [Plasmodium chabaudi chabaudi]|eukprot:XP_743699.2 conserved Plasmodium protein, unknown function [Plasmodium chabaudi chabaudi]
MEIQHPVLNILINKYKDLYDMLSCKTHIILLPESKMLLNADINVEFIKKCIFLKSHLKNIYVNLCDQCIEIDTKCVYTNYGYEENRICDIIKIETNPNYNFFKIIFINIPLEGDKYEDDFSTNSMSYNNNSSKYKNEINLFFHKNQTSKEYLHAQLSQFVCSYIIVKGYENYIGKKIVNIVDQTLKLQSNSNDRISGKDIKNMLIKYTYSYLYDFIWKQLIKNYQNIELKIQNKIEYLRKDINGFLEDVNLKHINMFHIEALSFHVKQIEKCVDPYDKIVILDNISQLICEIISSTNHDLKKQKIAIYDINSDSLISIIVAAISYGQIKNIISHSIHLHMYIENLNDSEKIDKLSFIFTIFHSSIMYLCDMKIS